MRYFLLFAIVITSLIGCNETKDTDVMNLTGTVKGLKKGTILFQKFEDTVLVTIDSVLVDGNSSFKFSDNVESPEIYYLYVRLKDGSLKDDRITFFAENSDINITTNLKNFGSAAVITGSENDKAYRDYLKLKDRYVIRNLSLIEERLKLDLNKNVSDSTAQDIENRQRALNSNKYFATINFALNHNDYELAPYLVLSEVYDANIKYLDTVYNKLTPKIKDSKYGKELESFIVDRKKTDTIL